jgi:hypothetical protein
VALAATSSETKIVSGTCEATSHTAEGQLGEDLTKRRSRFFCDTAVITFFDKPDGHVMVQFLQKSSLHEPTIGFAGIKKDGGQIAELDKIYLEPGNATKVSEGACKFFVSQGRLTGIMCAAKIDEGNRRTVAIVAFDVPPVVAAQSTEGINAAGKVDKCSVLLKIHGYLTRAQFQCGFTNYSLSMLSNAKSCSEHFDGQTMKRLLMSGMLAFDRDEHKHGHASICESILTKYPDIVGQ